MQTQQVILDVLKPTGTIVDLSDSFNARVGDQMTPFQLFILEGGVAKDLKGMCPELEAVVGNGALKGNKAIMNAGAKGVHWVGSTNNVTGYNQLTLAFPAEVFPQSGFCYGHLILANAAGVRESSVDIWFQVLDGTPQMGMVADHYDSELALELAKAKSMNDQFSQEMRAAYNQQVTDAQNALTKATANLNDLAGTAGDINAQIKAQNIVTLNKYNKDIARINGEITDRLAKIDNNIKSYKDLDAIRTAYPKGADGLFVTDDGHRAVYRNGQWIDGGVFQAAGPDPKSFWATYRFATSKLLEITKRNLITYDNLAIDTYLNAETGDYLPSMSGYDATDYIAVKPNTAYHLHAGWRAPDEDQTRNSHLVTFYNQNFEYLHQSVADNFNFTTKEDTRYLRVAFPVKEVGTLSLQMGTQYDWTKNPPELQIKPEAIGNVESSTNNLINVEMPFSLNYGLDDAGNYARKDGYSTYDFINLKGAKRLSFSSTPVRVAFYGQDYGYLSLIDYPDNGIEVPLNAVYIRVQYHNEQMEQQTANGNFLQISPDAFLKEPSNGREILKNTLVEDYHQPKFHLSDAVNQWLLNREFPIGFLGDSTTEGDNTSDWSDNNQHITQDKAAGGIGKIKYVNKTSYSYLAQQLLQQRTKNSAPEIYNMGWSGTSLFWLIQHFDEVFNGAYADVRMIGIEYGINDRNDYGNRDVLAQTYRYDLIRLIQMLYDRGVQPFIITSQAIWNHQADGARDVLNTVTLTTLINRIKKEVAREYHLELIDMQEVGNLIAKYSSVGWNSFNNGVLHFKDLGHQAEARYIYGKITDELEEVETGSILSYFSQRVLSDVFYGDNLQPADNDFKYTVNLTTSGKQLLQQFSVMNPHPQALQLISCCSTPDGQTVEVDGTTYQITSDEQEITKLESGPHIIRAFNDESKAITNWLGFKLK